MITRYSFYDKHVHYVFMYKQFRKIVGSILTKSFSSINSSSNNNNTDEILLRGLFSQNFLLLILSLNRGVIYGGCRGDNMTPGLTFV